MVYTGARRYSSTSTDGDLRVYASRHRDAMGCTRGWFWGEAEQTVAVRIADTAEAALDLELTVPAVSVTSLEIPDAGAPRARPYGRDQMDAFLEPVSAEVRCG